MEIFTSGTSGIPAERFFLRLKESGVSHIVDTRVHPSSQLAGYAKQDSLIFFANEILQINYTHEPLLCPEPEALKAYRNKGLSWASYQLAYLDLLIDRKLDLNLDTKSWGERPVLLCSEELPENCHRKIAAEYLEVTLSGITGIRHL